MVGVNKLAQAIERVGFMACQFALWVVLEEWFNSEQEPDFGVQAIMVCFFFVVMYLVGTTLDIPCTLPQPSENVQYILCILRWPS
jgi:hypothetical protein